MIVHFICRGNANRSLIAEAYLKSLALKNVTVLSSGTVADTYRLENEPRIPYIIACLDKYGCGRFAKTRSVQLTQARADGTDITVCMNQIVADECSHIITMPNNTITWNVVDTGEGQRTLRTGDDEYKYFEETYQETTQNLDKLVREKSLS